MNATIAAPTASTSVTPTLSQRLVSLDAYRGFVMFLMVAEVLHLGQMARNFPGNGFWAFLADQQSHREWVGCTLHDLIQPSFTFMVGVALPFSIANRLARGATFAQLLRHAISRSFILIFLGIFLRSVGAPQTRFTFEDTLTQIGLGYSFAFLLAFRPRRTQWIALAAILAGYWALFAFYPAPGTGYDWAAVGVAPDWPHHLSGFASHWDKNSNAAAAFDVWFLNLFPREEPFVYNGGGYLTLSFIPTLGTMVFGLIAGQWMRSERSGNEKFHILIRAGLLCLASGAALHFTGLCPIVKRIWTPSWTIFSAGWTLLFLAAFYWIIDLKGHRKWAVPLVVIGMNSIFTYCVAHLWEGFILSSFRTHLGQDIFKIAGTAYTPLLSGAAVILTLWIILYWMYRQRIFLRI